MQTSLFLLFGFLFAVSLGMVIIPRILVISHKKRLYDVPDARKVHTMPVPRLGGLSFFPVILMSTFLVIGFRLYFWDVNVSGLSFNMLYEYLFLFVGMTLLYLVPVVIAPAYLTGIHPLASVMGIYPHISEAAAAMVESLMQGVLPNTSPLVCAGSLLLIGAAFAAASVVALKKQSY